jgi:hypothetical protein
MEIVEKIAKTTLCVATTVGVAIVGTSALHSAANRTSGMKFIKDSNVIGKWVGKIVKDPKARKWFARVGGSSLAAATCYYITKIDRKDATNTKKETDKAPEAEAATKE